MSKFDNARVGDRVFDLLKGWGTIVEIRKNEEYPIYVNADIDSFCTFTLDGKRYVKDLTPTLFWSEVNIPTDEEDRNPFNLVEFLRENTRCVEFDIGKNNYCIHYDEENGILDIGYLLFLDYLGTVYLDGDSNLDYIVKKLNEHKVTPKELKDAYKLLGWI